MIKSVFAIFRFIVKFATEFTFAEGTYSRISRLKASGVKVFEATHVQTGVRSRFKVVEHVNVGRGYMLRDTEGKIGGVIGDWSLMNVKAR